MLPAGDYNVVCWGNVSRYSQEVINGGHEQCLLQHSTITASGRIETFDPLYYAFAEIELTDRSTASCVLDFRCAHIDLDFYVRGFCERFTGASHPEIRIRNIETCYDFAMHAYRTSDVVCFPIVRSDATPQVHTAQISILRTDEQTPMAICIHIPDGDEVFSLKMADLLNGDAAVRSAPISLDREEIRIPISVDFTGNSVDVTVEVPD